VAEAALVDASVIISLANLELTDKLFHAFAPVYVSQAVVRETKLRGRQRRRRDVVRFAKRMTPCKEWDQNVFQALLVAFALSRPGRPGKKHRGEAESIAQAVRLQIPVFLTDDSDAADEAEKLGIRVVSTMELLRLVAAG